FEFLILEGAQAGLSWATILGRRDTYRKAFANWDVKKVANFTKKDLDRLMQDTGIIRNRLKIRSAIDNANAFLAVQKEFGSFDRYLWGFVNNKQIVNTFKSHGDLPAKTALSDKISKDLKRRGFSFVGSTIIYAYLQAVGLVNDHEVSCPRWKAIQQKH
ncbi:MAG: DNA-3-methyladenine glycosylase I, partial [DPANN group archaeon]|nr:DNA-3-methyladenine glycosylase I [DPANN group archaeon]